MLDETQETHCASCGAEFIRSGCGTGYGRDPKTGARHCYACCGERDRADMLERGEATLYLTGPTNDPCRPYRGVSGRPTYCDSSAFEVTNWPGSLRFKPYHVTYSRHGGGFGSQRTDAWFTGPDGARWHAVNRGDSQIARCKRLKSAVG